LASQGVANGADGAIGTKANKAAAPSAIPIELTALLSPYREYGRLSLRVERLPNRARLSHGRNNGDRTWSLTLDDLEGLSYLPPEGMNEAHVLGIRIINLDHDYGATLAVLDYRISPEDNVPAPAPSAPNGAPDPDIDPALRRVRDELADLKMAQAHREADLGEARHQVERARSDWDKHLETELTAARTAWQSELEMRLAEAATKAAADLAEGLALWQAEEAKRLAQAAAHEQERIEQARELWRRETEAALAAAEGAWAAGEAVRLATAETRWREHSVQALAEATARCERAEAASAEAHARAEAAHMPHVEVELRHVNDELAEAKSLLARHEADLADARHEIERVRSEAGRQIAAELVAARTAWQSELEQCLADAAAKSAAALAESRAAWQADQEGRLAKADARERDRIEQARELWQRETDAALAEAAEAARAGEASRLAAAEARWQGHTARALAEAAARSERAEAALADARAQAQAAYAGVDFELRRVNDELSAANAALARREIDLTEARQATEAAPLETGKRIDAALAAARTVWQADYAAVKVVLADRETALTETGKELDACHQRWQRESNAALAQAEDAWKAAEALRLAAAEAQWREHSAQALAEATARSEQAEAALAAARAQIADAKARTPNTKRVFARFIQRQRRLARRSVAAGALAAAVAAAVWFLPQIELTASRQWWPGWPDVDAYVTTPIRSIVAQIGARNEAARPAPARLAEPRATIDATLAKLRAGPSTTSAVLATLPRDKEVVPVERRGFWVLIRMAGEDGKSKQEGWIYGSFLKDIARR
jgi:hypothetical protein